VTQTPSPTTTLTSTPTATATLTSTPVNVALVPGGVTQFSVPALLLVVIGAFVALMLWARQADRRG
jgi:hypothetical protein